MAFSIVQESRYLPKKLKHHSSLIEGFVAFCSDSFLRNYVKENFDLKSNTEEIKHLYPSYVSIIKHAGNKQLAFLNHKPLKNEPCYITFSYTITINPEMFFFSLLKAKWRDGSQIYRFCKDDSSFFINQHMIYIEDKEQGKTYGYNEINLMKAFEINFPWEQFARQRQDSVFVAEKDLKVIYNFSLKEYLNNENFNFPNNRPLFYTINKGKVQSIDWTHAMLKQIRKIVSKPSTYYLNKKGKISKRKFIINNIDRTREIEAFFKEIEAEPNKSLSSEETSLFEMNFLHKT